MSLPNPAFEASYCRLFSTDMVGIVGDHPMTDLFFKRFYEIFCLDADVAHLLKDTDMRRQMAMLKQSLFQLTSCCVLGQPSKELKRLAELHARLGVPPAMLDHWLSALLDTIAEFDPRFDETTRLAWCWALAPGLFYMGSFLGQDADLAVAERTSAAWRQPSSGAGDSATV